MQESEFGVDTTSRESSKSFPAENRSPEISSVNVELLSSTWIYHTLRRCRAINPGPPKTAISSALPEPQSCAHANPAPPLLHIDIDIGTLQVKRLLQVDAHQT